MSAESNVIVGAGPAGLTAALELVRGGQPCSVLESDPHYVGGIARTVRYKQYRLDIGGHRFYTKIDEVMNYWRGILDEDFLEVQRQSRIFFRGQFFDYPLRAQDVFLKLGVWETSMCVLSHLRRRMSPIPNEVSFEDWVTNRFGDRLFDMFFRSYTEKVWGMPCSDISADWAAQRIQGLSLREAIRNALTRNSNGSGNGNGHANGNGHSNGNGAGNGRTIKTLIDKFHYPRLGCGMMWEKAREKVEARGGRVELDRRVSAIHVDGGVAHRVDCVDGAGVRHVYPATNVISSMPLRELINAIKPTPPDAVVAAANRLRYRDFLTVALVVKRESSFPDQWIYIHDPDVKVGRVQNFKNWSAAMVPTPGMTVLGLEYFCFEGDGLWASTDEELIELGKREMEHIGLAGPGEVVDGVVVRTPKAYPIYDEGYKAAVETIREWLSGIKNLWSAGRNAMHQYNNQDHSMMTALLAARNLMMTDTRDPWNVNHEAEYLEERRIPRPLAGTRG